MVLAKKRMKKKQDAKQAELSDEITADYLYRLAAESVRMEDGRGRSLSECAAHLMSGIAIASVAYLTVAQPIFSFFEVSWQRIVLLLVYMLVSLCYLAAFILAVIALSGRKYCILEPPKAVSDALDGEFETRLQAAKVYCESLNGYCVSRASCNEKTLRVLCAAKTVMLVGTGVMAVAILFFVVVGIVLTA